MSLLMFDGFDQFGADAEVEYTDRWGRMGSTFDLLDVPVQGGRAMLYDKDTRDIFYKTLDTPSDTLILGYRYKLGGRGTGSGRLYIRDRMGLYLVYMQSDTQGNYGVYNGDNALLGEFFLPWDIWVYLEFKIKFHPTAGTLDIRMNEVSVVSLTGLDTVDNSTTAPYRPANMWFTNSSSYGTYYIDDMYICDGEGTVNNDFLGVCRCALLDPETDDSVAWTKSAGANNFENVNELILDTTTYNYSATVAQKDLFTFSDLPESPVDTHAVQVCVYAHKEVQEGRSLKLHLNTGANLNVSEEKRVDSSASYYGFTYFAEHQTGSTDWTESAVNALKAGYEIA